MIGLYDDEMYEYIVISKSTKYDLLGRKKGEIASNGKSDCPSLPLARMMSFSKHKLSCLMVFFTSELTLILGLLRCA